MKKSAGYTAPEGTPALESSLTIDQALERMKQFPGLRMYMAGHYRSWEYNYWDEETKRFLTENGSVWDINASRQCNELTGYRDWEPK